MNDFITSITKHIVNLYKANSLISTTVIEVYNDWVTKSGCIVPAAEVSYLIRYTEDVINIVKMAGVTPFERSCK